MFAHLCETGGARRTWLRGIDKVRTRYLSVATAFNLGRIMRLLIGAGKPRFAQVLAEGPLLTLLNILAGLILRLTDSGAARDQSSRACINLGAQSG